MWSKIFTRIGLVGALLLLASTVYAQGAEPQDSDPYWRAAYWNNLTFSGDPVYTATADRIDFDWGYGSPHHTVATEGFTARWRRYLDLPADTYRFTATSDDGIRVYVDGQAIIDEWHVHSVRTYSADISLQAGHHLVIVEYYENTGLAVARVSWAPASTQADRWRGQYYANRSLSGQPALIRDDEQIDFNWGYGSPATGLPSEGFSVLWTRTLNLQGSLYRFTTTTDDGVRLWVNGHLLIDEWHDQAAQSHAGTIYASGQVPVVMHYYENGGVASARLTWARVDGEPPAPTEVIVEDGGDGFRQGGAYQSWRTVSGGHGGQYVWTRNNDRWRPDYNWARWYADLEAGRYEVYVYVPEQNATTTNARYWVAHWDGFARIEVNQAANRGRWVSLGTYRFRGQGADYVSLSDITYEPYLSTNIGFDAVKWVPR